MLSDASLTRLAAELGNEWRSLGISLGLSKAQVDQCLFNHPGDIKAAMVDMLVRWQLQTSRRGPKAHVQVADLVQALVHVGRMDLAEKVEDGDFIGSESEEDECYGASDSSIPGCPSFPDTFSQDNLHPSGEAILNDCVSQLQKMGFSDQVSCTQEVQNLISAGLWNRQDIVQTFVENKAQAPVEASAENTASQWHRRPAFHEDLDSGIGETVETVDGTQEVGRRAAASLDVLSDQVPTTLPLQESQPPSICYRWQVPVLSEEDIYRRPENIPHEQLESLDEHPDQVVGNRVAASGRNNVIIQAGNIVTLSAPAPITDWIDWRGTMLAKVTVEHLQCFKEPKTLQLHPRTTAVIGPNSSGKTILLRALLLFTTLCHETSHHSRLWSQQRDIIPNSVIINILGISEIRAFWHRRNTENNVKVKGIDAKGNEVEYIIKYEIGGAFVSVDKMVRPLRLRFSHNLMLAVLKVVDRDAYKPQVPTRLSVPSTPVVTLDHTLAFSMLCELEKDASHWDLLGEMLKEVRPGCAIRIIRGARQKGQRVIMVQENSVDIPLHGCDSSLVQIVAVLAFVLHSLKVCFPGTYRQLNSSRMHSPVVTLLLDDIASFLARETFRKLLACLTSNFNLQTITTTLRPDIAEGCDLTNDLS